MTILLITLTVIAGLGYVFSSHPHRFYLNSLVVFGLFGAKPFTWVISTFRKPSIDRFVMKWELAEAVGNCSANEREARTSIMSDLEKLLFSELDYNKFFGEADVHDLALDNDAELARRVMRYFEVFAILDAKLNIDPAMSPATKVKQRYGKIIASLGQA